MKILVTGSAGFIGAHLCAALSANTAFKIHGLDDFNNYYDPQLKRARISSLASNVQHNALSIEDLDGVLALFRRVQPDVVVHLAAQAGVRHSFKVPMDYARSNLTGQVSMLEAARHTSSVKRVIYASSSSVYSGVNRFPFDESMTLETPKSLYAASKIADEVLSKTYSSLHDIDMIGLRFFTVYGPWGRPDMAYWSFTNSILEGAPIKLFNHGNIWRDFTYIDDITSAIVRMVGELDGNNSVTPQHRVYNIGNNKPVPVKHMIEILEDLLGKRANIELDDLPPGDMVKTYANIDKLQADYGFVPNTPIETGLSEFTQWFTKWSRQLHTVGADTLGPLNR